MCNCKAVWSRSAERREESGILQSVQPFTIIAPFTMADLDEDMPVTSLHSQSHEDNDPSDETQDFRLLSLLTSKSSGQLPKRGEKDFEPHGTKHQDGVLAASRQAMHDALSYTRVHTPKAHIRAFYYGSEGLRRDEIIGEEWRQSLDEDHIVVVESAKSVHFRSMGRATTGKPRSSLWLLPEEALYLVERGALDLWWPSRSSFTGVVEEDEDGNQINADALKEQDEGFPMSLQAAYALLIGKDGEKGKVSLDRYTVYANLKRSGYMIMRAHKWDLTKPGETQVHQAVQGGESTSIFTWLFWKLFAEKEVEHLPYGPLVRPGMYRSYNSIYRQIAVIPRHKPSPNPTVPAPPPQDPYRVVFQLWKPSRASSFAKSNPGEPDFRVAITDARSSSVPSLTQVTSLIESTPWSPPNSEWKGPSKTSQRLKNGWRNVILAVIDQGVISYLELGEIAFGEEKLYERFDRGSFRGTKRGGGAWRGRGGRGGRGRGRGRS
jgi:tRNA-splicing endonuclease subunit Sen54